MTIGAATTIAYAPSELAVTAATRNVRFVPFVRPSMTYVVVVVPVFELNEPHVPRRRGHRQFARSVRDRRCGSDRHRQRSAEPRGRWFG